MTIQSVRLVRDGREKARGLKRYQAQCPYTYEWFTVSHDSEIPSTSICPCCGIRWGLLGLKWPDGAVPRVVSYETNPPYQRNCFF